MKQDKSLAAIAFIFGLCVSFSAHSASKETSTEVIGADDQVAYPPFVAEIPGIKSINANGKEKSIALVAGDLFHFGDSVFVPWRGILVGLFSPDIFFVLSSGSSAKLGQETWKTTEGPYSITLHLGWMRVEDINRDFWIRTDQANLKLDHGSLWVQALSKKTEIYMEDGLIEAPASHKTYIGKVYLSWESNAEPKRMSDAWDPTTLKNQVSGLTKRFVQIIDDSRKKWQGGDYNDAIEIERKKRWKSQ